MIRLMNTDGFLGPVNIGNASEFTIKELAEKILNKVKSTSKIVYRDLPSDDPKQRKPDIAIAQEKLHWEPEISLDKGLDKTIEYFKGVVGKSN